MTNTRFQVVEIRHGYAVKDTATGGVVSRTYSAIGWAARRAIRENEATRHLIKSKPFLK